MKNKALGFFALVLAMIACNAAPAIGATPTPLPPTHTETPAFTATLQTTAT